MISNPNFQFSKYVIKTTSLPFFIHTYPRANERIKKKEDFDVDLCEEVTKKELE